jgi:hypothetical protein
MLGSTLPELAAARCGGLDELVSRSDNEERRLIVVRWCGLRRHNAVGRFLTPTRANEAVRALSNAGVTEATLSTIAIITDHEVEALIGAHSEDEHLVERACDVMRSLGARSYCFESR